MTKAQAVKELERLGWQVEPNKGESYVWATSPNGQRGYYHPADLLEELAERDRQFCRRHHVMVD